MVGPTRALPWNSRYAAAVAIVITCLLSACRAKGGQPKIPALQAESHAKALEVWTAYSLDVESALAGVPHHGSLENARRFFSEVSGIEIRLDLTYIGAIPTAETKDDWERVKTWFDENQEGLYWSGAEQKVKVRGP